MNQNKSQFTFWDNLYLSIITGLLTIGIMIICYYSITSFCKFLENEGYILRVGKIWCYNESKNQVK